MTWLIGFWNVLPISSIISYEVGVLFLHSSFFQCQFTGVIGTWLVLSADVTRLCVRDLVNYDKRNGEGMVWQYKTK